MSATPPINGNASPNHNPLLVNPNHRDLRSSSVDSNASRLSAQVRGRAGRTGAGRLSHGANTGHDPRSSSDENSKLLMPKAVRPTYLRALSHQDFLDRTSSPVPVEIPTDGGAYRPPAKSYLAYYIPAISWMREYSFDYFLGDLCAGLSVASFQIPVSMSYAAMANLPTVCGLYGLIVPPLIYAILGSVPQMVVGPEAAIVLVMSHAISKYIHPGDELPLPHITSDRAAGLIAGSAGGILFGAGLLRLGYLNSILSRSLLRGFISAVGVVMIVDQLPAELGIKELMHSVIGTHPGTLEKIKFIYEYYGQANALTTKFAFTVCFLLLASRFLKKRFAKKYNFLTLVPEILIAVLLSTFICDYFDLDQQGLETVGEIKPGAVNFQWFLSRPNWVHIKLNFTTSFFVGLLGFLESSIAAKALGSKYDLNISTNRELVALGITNIFASTVCALPSFGGYGRSKINALSGAQTHMSAIVLSCVTLFSTLFLMSMFYYLPKCVLASVITVIGVSLVEEAPADLKFYWKIGGYNDLATLLLTFFATVFWSVEVGMGTGVIFSVSRVIRHANHPRIQILGRCPGTQKFMNADEFPDRLEAVEGCLIVKIPEPLTFANTGDLRNRLRRLEFYGTMKIHPSQPRLLTEEGLNHMIFDLGGMTEIDAAACQIFLEIIQNYRDRHIKVSISRLQDQGPVYNRLERSGILDCIREDSQGDKWNFDSIGDALDYWDNS